MTKANDTLKEALYRIHESENLLRVLKLADDLEPEHVCTMLEHALGEMEKAADLLENAIYPPPSAGVAEKSEAGDEPATCERTHERYRPDGSVERSTSVVSADAGDAADAPEVSELRRRVDALGCQLVISDRGEQYVLGGLEDLSVLFLREEDDDDELAHWLEHAEAEARSRGPGLRYALQLIKAERGDFDAASEPAFVRGSTFMLDSLRGRIERELKFVDADQGGAA